MVVANAQEKDVSITVDHRDVNFTDQIPVIEQDRVLVPLRDVFNAMGAKVEWDGEKREVIINSKDNINRLMFTIDNPEFTKLTFVTILDTKIEKLTTDVAPKIINDRTMIPLRVVSENFNADVNWDAENYHITIATKQFKKALGVEKYDDTAKYTEYSEKIANLSLAADKETAAVGETVTLTVNLSNATAYENTLISGLSVNVNYDTEKFEYAGCKIVTLAENEEPYALADNPSFKEGVAKVVLVYDPTVVREMKDSSLLEISFKAKAAGEAQFSIENTFTSGKNDNYISTFVNDAIEVFDVAERLYLSPEAITVTVGGEADENTEDVVAEETAEDAAEDAAATDEK